MFNMCVCLLGKSFGEGVGVGIGVGKGKEDGVNRSRIGGLIS